MSSVFKGLTEYYGGASDRGVLFKDGEVFIGQVLDVGKNTTTFDVSGLELTPETNPYMVGTIRFLLANGGNKAEKKVIATAEPLDRGNYRLPFAGEQVLLVRKLGRYYYFHVVTPSFFMRNNIDPLLLQDAQQSTGAARRGNDSSIPRPIEVDADIEAQRFIIKNDFEEGTLQYTAGAFTKVREGDTILEGRMGGVIKLTQTITKEGVWNPETQILNIGQSIDGDPMLIMEAAVRRKNIATTPLDEDIIEDHDINGDRSSFYLTTSQVVPLQVASSKKMNTWSVSVRRGELSKSDDPATRFSAMFPEQTYDPDFVPSVNVSGLESLAYDPNAANGLGNITGVSDPGVPGSSAKAKSFDEIKLKFQELGYQLPTGVHFVGIRSVTNININNSGVQTKNKFADLVGVVNSNTGEAKFFPATTVPGRSYLTKFFDNETRTAILKPGQYNSIYQIGQHAGKYKAFRESGTYIIYTDKNLDDVPDATPQNASGNFHMNLHRAAANGVTTDVNDYSAGCQVFAAPTSLAEVLRQAEASGQQAFTYTLLMSW